MSSSNRRFTRSVVQHRGRKVPGLFVRHAVAGDTFEARVKLDGRSHRKTLGSFETVGEAVRALEEFKVDLRGGVPEAQSRKVGVTVAGAVDLYRECLLHNGCSPRTIEAVDQRRRHFGRLNERTIASISRSDVQGLVLRLQRDNYAGTTIGSVVGLLSAVFSTVCVPHGFASANPSDGVALPKKNSGARRILDVEETHRLIDGATEKMRPLVATLALTGLRVSECLALTWGDVTDGVIAVTKQIGSDGNFASLKTAKSRRRIAMPSRLAEILVRPPFATDDDLVFQSTSGRFIDRRRANRIVNEAALRAGIIERGETFRVHDLRGSCVTNAIRSGMDLASAQRMLGHSTPRTTLAVYAAVSEDEVVGTAAFEVEEAVVLSLAVAR